MLFTGAIGVVGAEHRDVVALAGDMLGGDMHEVAPAAMQLLAEVQAQPEPEKPAEPAEPDPQP